MVVKSSTNTDGISQTTLIGTIAAFSVASTCMTLANKVTIQQYPHPNTLILLQNLVGLFVTFLLLRRHLVWMSLDKMHYWIPTILLFCGVLLSSLKAFLYLNVTTVMIFRNTSPIPSTILECLLFGALADARVFAAACSILLGAVVYGMHSTKFHPTGLMWLMVNISCIVAELLYNKFLIQRGKEFGLNPISLATIKTLLSSPVFLLLALIEGELSVFEIPTGSTAGYILLTGCICLVLAIAGWQLQSVITATSFMVLGNINKVATIFFSLILLGETFHSMRALFGCVIALGGGAWYSYERLRLKEAQIRHDAHAHRSSGPPSPVDAEEMADPDIVRKPN
eukprot:NODE_1248_length_1504_cov_16.674227_g1039_i0.p1 GENE.NODE_1248_length_1504_cov_16.674227_g1039_i0~~NODE_1248_length_1504_cov_16.674227_g1039_i0.p1  ORF type:complete len:340 (+),score=65.64 NODE_1248_length_1504_cov_16.674227_g1039_i0:462-1481(+)